MLSTIAILALTTPLLVTANRRQVQVTGAVNGYADCSKYRADGYDQCVKLFPAWNPDGDQIMTSGACLTDNSRYADACVQSVDDRRAFSYAFLYPPRFARTVTNDPSSSITERNTRPVMVNGKATTYAQCGGLQSQGNEACKVLPEYSSDPKKLVRYQCINANVEIGNKCYNTVTYDGKKTYTWDFTFPPTPQSRAAVQERNTKRTMTQGAATTYKRCSELLMTGNKGCEIFPQWNENPEWPVRYKCIDANVAVANQCFAKVNPEGTSTYNYDFTYPPLKTRDTTDPESNDDDMPVPDPEPDSDSDTDTESIASRSQDLLRVQSIGEAKSYADCSMYREKGNRACDAVPVYKADGGPVRSQCVDQSVLVGDWCVRAMDAGSKSFWYNFWFSYRA